jgi:hypothetical protein
LNKFKSPLVAKTSAVSKISKKTPKARGLSAKGHLSSSWSRCVEAPSDCRCHLLLAASEGQGDPPWSCSAAPRSPLLSPLSGSIISLSHEPPPSNRAPPPWLPPSAADSVPPCLSEALRRSASPSSISPPKELSRRAWSRHHCRGYLTGNRAPPLPNCSPPSILRPNQAHQRT